jgi:hypothetical protein
MLRLSIPRELPAERRHIPLSVVTASTATTSAATEIATEIAGGNVAGEQPSVVADGPTSASESTGA